MGGSDGCTGRPKNELVLSGEERETLERSARRHTSARSLALAVPDRVDVRVGSISILLTRPWCCASTRRVRSRRSHRTVPMLPLLPGTPERRTHDYRHHGVTNLYAALDVASGDVIADLTTRHRAEEFRRFVNLIDRNVPRRPRCARHRRQLFDHKDTIHPTLVGASPTVHAALDADLPVMAEPGRAMVRRAHPEMAQTRNPPLDTRTRGINPHLDRTLERRTSTVRMAQDRRRDPRQPRRILPADLRLRSLRRPCARVR